MLKNVLIVLLAAALAAALLLCRREQAPPVPPEGDPRLAEIAAILGEAAAEPGLRGAAVGFCLLDPEGRVWFEQAGETAFIPASSLKTLTTATALEVLGPDFRIVTELKATAPVTNGIIHGDVVITGGGDPTLRGEDLEAWAAELRKRGVRRIAGRVRGDGSLFRGSLFNDHWNWGDIGNGYGSPVGGLNVDHNRFTLYFAPGAKAGDPAGLRACTQAVIAGFEIENEVVSGPPDSGDGVVVYGGEKAGVLRLRGTVPAGRENFGVQAAIPDPVAFAARLFTAFLKEQGIEVAGGGPFPAAAQVLLTHRSAPLVEIIRHAHEVSDNHETECLFRLLGVRAGKPPAEVVRAHWEGRGLRFTALRMEDGCGLARADVITPRDLARLQYLARNGPQGDAFWSTLVGNAGVRGKGGAMSGVRSFAGFATGRAGVPRCFAFLVNHAGDTEAVARLRQRLIEALWRL